MKFPIKKSRSFFRKIGSCASYASYASYAYCASENRRMFGIKTMGMNSFHRPRGGSPPSMREVWGFAGQGLRPCRRLDIGALRSPLSPFARPPTFYRLSISLSPYLPPRGRGTARRRWKESAGSGRRKKPRREGFSSRRGFFYALRD